MFDNYINIINHKLEEIVSDYPDGILKESIAYSLLNGGKRLRPLLVLLLLDDLNINIEKGINQACAIEMIHTYSLIHDDLPAMDNDDYRRGKLTNHKIFGEAIAILAADALLTDSFNYFTKGDITLKNKCDIVTLAAKNAGGFGMVYGQALDMKSSHQDVNIEDVILIHTHKTKDLINLAIETGGIIANLSENNMEKLDNISYYIGMSFQIKDDVDDFESGKNNSDIINEKATYPAVIGLVESKKIQIEYKVKALKLIEELLGRKQLYALTERIL